MSVHPESVNVTLIWKRVSADVINQNSLDHPGLGWVVNSMAAVFRREGQKTHKG